MIGYDKRMDKRKLDIVIDYDNNNYMHVYSNKISN